MHCADSRFALARDRHHAPSDSMTVAGCRAALRRAGLRRGAGFASVLAFAALLHAAPAVALGPPLYITQWGGFGSTNGTFNTPTGISADFNTGWGRTLIYVADTNNNRIQIFETSGAFFFSRGTLGSGDGFLHAPADVVSPENIYVADVLNGVVQMWSGNGHDIPDVGIAGTPTGIAIDANKDFYVADSLHDRILKYHDAGLSYTFLGQWGTSGSGNGQLSAPARIALGPTGNLFVVDRNNNRIEVFTNTGGYVTQWGGFGAGNGQFDHPTGIAVSPSGLVYVADRGNHRIQEFNSAGDYLTQWGTLGSDNGQFNAPSDVGVDGSGNVYVVDTNNQSIQKFGPDTSPPTASVTAPASGDAWTGTSTHDITWTASDNVGVATIDLEFSSNNCASWTPIASGLANSGTYAWTLPNTPTTLARVRATAHDVNALTGSGTSGIFTVVDPATAAPGPGALEFAIARPSPNPARSGVRLRFSLPYAGSARLEIADVEGRRMWPRDFAAAAAGVHELAWDGRDDAGAPASAGTYFVRLTSGAGVRTARVALLH